MQEANPTLLKFPPPAYNTIYNLTVPSHMWLIGTPESVDIEVMDIFNFILHTWKAGFLVLETGSQLHVAVRPEGDC